jgi:hypothetical protein
VKQAADGDLVGCSQEDRAFARRGGEHLRRQAAVRRVLGEQVLEGFAATQFWVRRTGRMPRIASMACGSGGQMTTVL